MRLCQIFAVAAVAIAGCGPDTSKRTTTLVPVKVKVVKDGKSLGLVQICFVPKSAGTFPGEFELDANGSPVGVNGEAQLGSNTYGVYFQALSNPKPADRAKAAEAFKSIPAKFTKQSEPALEVVIDGKEERTITVQ